MRIVLNIQPGRIPLPSVPLPLLVGLLLAAPAAARGEQGGAREGSPAMALDAALPDPAEDAPCEHGKAFTGDATPVEPGHVELEIAYAPTWWATAGTVDRQAGDQHPVVAALGVGIARDLDARLALGWTVVHASPAVPGAPAQGQGLTDATVAVRWRFLSLPEPRIDLAVSTALTVPTGAQATPDHLGTTGGSFSLGGSLLASADWGRFTAGAEIGFSAPLGATGVNDVGLVACNAAVGYQLLPWLQPEVELNYQHEIERGVEPDERVLWATGALVLPVDAVRLVVGARLPIWARATPAGPMVTAAVKYAF